MSAPLPVLIDVDTGYDDALALLLALRSPALHVRGVTCVAGNQRLPQVVTNTLKLMDVLSASTPVAAGMDPGPTLDAMADMSLGIASIATEGQPTLWLNVVRDQLDALLDELERGGLA